MSASGPPTIGAGGCGPGLCDGRAKATLELGLWGNNPIAVQMLGICSALAVTYRVENSLVMGLAVVFVIVASNVLVSLMRGAIPRRIRMIAEVGIIATFVIVFDLVLKAYYFEMSRELGPYVALIITNCIVMGRAEAFALHNGPVLSAVDGLANGLGYAAVLVLVGVARELGGQGKLLGRTLLPEAWYTPNDVLATAPGAFLVMGFLVAAFYALHPRDEDDEAEARP